MNTITQNQQIKEMNELFEEWRSQFDNKPELGFAFDVDEKGMVSLKNTMAKENTILCHASEVDMDSLEFDLETVAFRTKVFEKKQYEFEIGICWVYDRAPEISFVHRIETLYSSCNVA